MWQKRIRPFQSGQRIAYPAPGVFNQQTLTGGLNFIGNQTKSTSRSLVAAILSFIGSQSKAISRPLVVATLSFVGTITKRTFKSVASVLLFNFSTGRFIVTWYRIIVSGTPAPPVISPLIRTINYPLTAGLSFVGQETKGMKKTFVASLSFVGAITKQTLKSVASVLLFNFATGRFIITQYRIIVSGTPNSPPIDSLTKVTNYPLTGGLSFIGQITKRMSKAFIAGLSFVGNFIRGRIIIFAASMLARAKLKKLRWYMGPFKFASRAMFRAVSRAREMFIQNRNKI